MIVIITDTNVQKLITLNYPVIAFPAGEEHKTREIKAWIEDQLLKMRCGRDTTILAIGGGVVLDMAGFVAATYMRGIPYISVPTTLLAMVDASIGGKTGVNTPLGKNLVGAFYPPERIDLDLSWLKTLPEKEWINGYAEIVKYALIADPEIIDLPLEKQIERSIEIKQKIVEQDPHEHGVRRILNFGHTIGHALETLTNFSVSHGEAVFFGMLVESRMSPISEDELEKIEEVIFRYCPHFSFTIDLSWDWTQTLACDKKSKKQKPRMVLLSSLGTVCHFKGHYCEECRCSSLEIAHYARAALCAYGKREKLDPRVSPLP